MTGRASTHAAQYAPCALRTADRMPRPPKWPGSDASCQLRRAKGPPESLRRSWARRAQRACQTAE
eukprot:13915919-Heterocapsa_arctica.AAC.1